MTSALADAIVAPAVAAVEDTLLDRFSIVVARSPQRLAIASGRRALTFADVAGLAAGVANAIVSTRARRQGPIAILLPAGVEVPAAILGVLAAGHGCIPLDADHPLERNRLIATTAGASMVISIGSLLAQARALFPQEIAVLDIGRVQAASWPPACPAPRPDDLAFIIYTSGSTGVPKGVYQDHRGVAHDIGQAVATAGIRADDRICLFYAPSVIAGLRNMLNGVATGASLHVLPPAVLGPEGLVREIQAQRLTLVSASPGLFRHIADALSPGEVLDSVRLVLLGGDRIEWSDVDVFTRCVTPAATLCIVLGSTECWTVYAQWLVDVSLRARGGRLPVGRGLPDREVTIVGDDGAPARDGETGECVVRSRYIARGYWQAPELTAQVFAADPIDPALRSFRTGDLAVRRPDGLLEFVGRKDQQIKLAGRRIEPGEIEAALKRCDGVRDAAVLVRADPSGAPRALVGYAEVGLGVRGLLSRHLKAMLVRRLPRHMVPATVVPVETLPRLASFKIDRPRLAQIDLERLAAAPPREADPVIDRIARTFEAVLGVTGVTAVDNFASLGGDSLQAIRLAAALWDGFDLQLSLDTLDATDSIADLADWVFRQERPPRGGGDAIRRVAEWGDAIERLAKSGQLEAAQHEARQLKAAHPEVGFASSLVALLEQMPPPLNDRPPFHDDQSRDLQVVEHPGAEAVMLVFSGLRHDPGIPLAAAHRWLARVPATLVYLRDLQGELYLGGVASLGSRQATIDGLRRLIGDRRVMCLGVSAGSFAAMHYGLDLGAEAVAALGGPLHLDRESNTHLSWAALSARLRRAHPGAIVDLRHLYARAPRPPRALVLYGDHAWDDRLHAEDMGRLSSARLLPVENCIDHHLMPIVIKRRWFEHLLAWLLTPGGVGLPPVIGDRR